MHPMLDAPVVRMTPPPVTDRMTSLPQPFQGEDIFECKGGFDRASWIGRYTESLLNAGFKPYEAECWALNAWEASPEDADPDDTASDDLAYAAEDSL